MDRKTVGKNIRAIRKEKGISQAQLASLLGYKDHSALAKVETGVNDITVETLYRYADVLGVPVDALLGERKSSQGKKIYHKAYEMIGSTPLLELCNIEKELGLACHLYAKVELFNPSGSVKDRVALAMIEDAEKEGIISPGATLIEPTSGNTGIGLASVAASKGYHAILVMPETMSIERRRMIAAYGTKIELTPGNLGMQGAVDKAKELAFSIPNSFIPSQFDNPSNPNAHYRHTGPEIFKALKGDVDAFVAGIGTGGTISGVGKYLKEKKKVYVVGVEPASSPLLSKGKAGPHKIQGIGANFIPKNFQKEYVDEIMPIPDEEAFAWAKLVGKKEGILVGISSGASLSAAITLAKRNDPKIKNIVVLFPDGGDRYFSTPLFTEE